MIRISVAMCTYNGEKYLPEQLASISAQTRLPDELVICDDGSTDSTPEIVDAFARSVSFPVRFIRNPENLGSTKNFEKAIGLCTGDLIALSDQDDIWMPRKLARQAAIMDNDPELGGVFSDAELVDAQSRPIGMRLWTRFHFTPRKQRQFAEGNAIPILIKWNVVTGATLMFRSSLRSVFSPIPKCWYHDGWIAWMAVLYSKLRWIEEPLIHYRIHPEQQAGVDVAAFGESITLRQRLEGGKRRGPDLHLSEAAQLEELEKTLIAGNNIASRAAIPTLRSKISFLRDRANQHGSHLARLMRIVRNIRNYYRYERGLKSCVKDILIVFI